jgi:hypothetical protein
MQLAAHDKKWTPKPRIIWQDESPQRKTPAAMSQRT